MEPYDIEAIRKAITDREMKLDEEIKKAKDAGGKKRHPKKLAQDFLVFYLLKKNIKNLHKEN